MINILVVYTFFNLREFMVGGNKQRSINELQYYELNRITPLSE